MKAAPPIQGELQAQLMPVLWRVGEGTVEELRAALPSRHRGAYTTVQTVLNRMTECGLLERRRRGPAFVYRARLTESEYLARSVSGALAGATPQARQAVLAQLVGDLDADEIAELRAIARDLRRPRR